MGSLITPALVVAIVLFALAINDIITPTYLWLGGVVFLLIALLLDYLKSVGAIK